MKSVFFRFFIMTALLLMVSITAIGAAVFPLFNNYLSGQRQEQLNQYAKLMIDSAQGTLRSIRTLPYFVQDPAYLLQDATFISKLEMLSEASGTHIILADVADDYGAVLFQTGDYTAGKNTARINAAILDSLFDDSEQKFKGTLGGYYKGTYYTVAYPVLFSNFYYGQYVAVLFISLPANNTEPLAWAFIRWFILVSMVVVTVAAISAYMLSRRILAPLRLMRGAVASFTLGDYTARINVRHTRGDEIGELSAAFNSMADSLEKSEAARGGFIANISHEMRTPMTNVLGYIDGVLDGTLPRDRMPQYLGVIRDEMKRLSRLVQRMLDSTRLQSGEYEVHPRAVVVSELAARVLLSFEPMINDKRLGVEADLPEAAWCLADDDAIAQVCTNLIDNAIKFADPASKLTVSVTPESEKLWFAVTNEGDEIPAEDLPFIFDRFHKADRSRARDPSGLGLGLHMVKTIVNSHREYVYAESDCGETTFRFSLPRCERP